jgi:hypothetical protein
MQTLDFIMGNTDVLRWCVASYYLSKVASAEELGKFFETCKMFEGRYGSEEFVGSFANAGFHLKSSEHNDTMQKQLKTSIGTVLTMIDQRHKSWLRGPQDAPKNAPVSSVSKVKNGRKRKS